MEYRGARVGFELLADGDDEDADVVGLGVLEAPHLFEHLALSDELREGRYGTRRSTRSVEEPAATGRRRYAGHGGRPGGIQPLDVADHVGEARAAIRCAGVARHLHLRVEALTEASVAASARARLVEDVALEAQT